jgi:hypothetical protein
LLVVKGCGGMAPAFVPRRPRGALPEICQKLRYAQPHAAPRHHPLAVLLTCSVAWVGEVVHGDVNPRRIDGKDGVAGSIPAGGSTTDQQVRPGHQPTCRAAKSRQPRLPESLPVRLVRSESGCVACQGHSKASLAPVDLTLEGRHGPSRASTMNSTRITVASGLRYLVRPPHTPASLRLVRWSA